MLAVPEKPLEGKDMSRDTAGAFTLTHACQDGKDPTSLNIAH